MDGEVGERARDDLADTINTVTYVVENADKIGAKLVEGAVETAKGVAEGDLGAITRFTSFAASVVVPAGGPRALLAQTARTATTVVRATAATGRAVVKTSAAVVRAGKRAAVASARAAKRTAVAGARATRRAMTAAANTSRRVARSALQQARKVFQRKRDAIPRKCFVAGTLVTTLSGLVPIEDIQIGDQVLARSEETGELSLREVTETFVTPDKAIWEVDVEDASGAVETLGTTAEHPFAVQGEGWVLASQLQPGDPIGSAFDAKVSEVVRKVLENAADANTLAGATFEVFRALATKAKRGK